jgi:hypothetical protein
MEYLVTRYMLTAVEDGVVSGFISTGLCALCLLLGGVLSVEGLLAFLDQIFETHCEDCLRNLRFIEWFEVVFVRVVMRRDVAEQEGHGMEG